MKKLKTIDKSKLIKVLLFTLMVCLSVQLIYSFIPSNVFCNDDLIKVGVESAKIIQDDTYKLAVAIIVPALMLIGLALLLVRNERKIAGLITAGITCILAFIFIIWVYNGNIVSTVTKWFGN